MALNRPGTVWIVVGHDADVDPSELRERVMRCLTRAGRCDVLCDVSRVTEPDVATIDALARLQLTARRCGGELRLKRVPERLHSLLELAGMCDVVGCGEGEGGE